jgi:hypothetical protein
MKAYTLLLFAALLLGKTYGQQLSPQELLDKAIAFHDPDGQWPQFKDSLHIVMSTPNASDRDSRILINLPDDYFSVQATRDGQTSFYEVSKGICSMTYNGMSLDSTSAKERGMSCERALLYKNYYSYLYGLPMKLKDPGTILAPAVEETSFKGRNYLRLSVSYDPAVGTDRWYFYFNPETYALEVYQFYKTDESGSLLAESGEYILLKDLEDISGIRMPKIRSWYYNKNNQLLGTDRLMPN